MQQAEPGKLQHQPQGCIDIQEIGIRQRSALQLLRLCERQTAAHPVAVYRRSLVRIFAVAQILNFAIGQRQRLRKYGTIRPTIELQGGWSWEK